MTPINVASSASVGTNAALSPCLAMVVSNSHNSNTPLSVAFAPAINAAPRLIPGPAFVVPALVTVITGPEAGAPWSAPPSPAGWVDGGKATLKGVLELWLFDT